MSKIWLEIDDMVGERYEYDTWHIKTYDDNDIHLASAIADILSKHEVEYTIEQEDCFESPSCDITAVFAAWIENGKLLSISYTCEL